MDKIDQIPHSDAYLKTDIFYEKKNVLKVLGVAIKDDVICCLDLISTIVMFEFIALSANLIDLKFSEPRD